MNKQLIKKIMRQLRVLNIADKIYFYKIKKVYEQDNINFVRNHQDRAVPPEKMLFEILGNNSFSGYWESGIDDAKWLRDIIKNYKPEEELKIAEWGCGLARVLRHIKNSHYSCYGYDYCEEYVDWCSTNITDCSFFKNNLSPPLNVKENTFDVLYCISVFTHLSERRHLEWSKEILRVLKPGGLFIGTFHGEKYKHKLLADEKRLFETGRLIVQDKVLEGSKNYAAYQSSSFLKKTLLKDFENVEEIGDLPFHQNVWCATKPLTL